jgi:hypothetical protein
MDLGPFAALLVMLLFVAAIVKLRRRRRRGWGGPGAGASGAMYELLNEDKRKAFDIVLEEKAEERDPETADGNLPELESPKRE